jgi:hypothetical protein
VDVTSQATRARQLCLIALGGRTKAYCLLNDERADMNQMDDNGYVYDRGVNQGHSQCVKLLS